MTPQKSPSKNLSTGTSGTSYQSSKPASTKRHPSASKKEGGHAKASHASPTTGLSSQHKHQASSRGQRRGPSSIARKDFVDVRHLDLLLRHIDVLTMKRMPGLATSGEGVVPKDHLRLRDEERQVWQGAIELMAEKGEFTVARRLLAMCDTATRAALFQALSQPCLKAMLSNPVTHEQRSFVQLIRTTVEHAIAKGRSECALPLLDRLPPFDRADALLSLTDLHSSPQPLVASKAPEALTRSVAMSDECWELLVVVLQPVVYSVADQKGQPVLELGPKQISVSQPLQAGRDVSQAFSQAIAYLQTQGHVLQACQLLSMCDPLACAYVLQGLMQESPACVEHLAGHSLFAKAVAGCLAHADRMPLDDLTRLQGTLKQLEKYRPKPAIAGVSAERASSFWQAYAACSDAERKDLRWRVPAAFPPREAAGIDTGQLPSDVSQDIDLAFAVSPEAGLLACEGWLGQLPALTLSHPAKALSLAWTVVCALETHAPSEQWTEAQRNRRTRWIERPLEQPLGVWTLAVLPGIAQADQSVVLAALVEQAANVPVPRCVTLLAQWVDVHAQLLGAAGSSGLAASAQPLRHGLLQGLTSLLNDLGPYGDEGLRSSMKALMTRLSGGLGKRFEKALVGGRLEEAADWVGEMFQSGDPEAGDCFMSLVGAIKKTLGAVDLAFGQGEGGLSVVSTLAPQGEAVPLIAPGLGQQQVVLERAVLCLEICGNGDESPFLPALHRWLQANPVDGSLLTPDDRRKIEAYRTRVQVARQSLATWTPGASSLHQVRRWLGALRLLGQPLGKEETQAILDELSRPEFGQWMDAVMQTRQGRAGIERALFDLLCSPHVDEQTLRWLVGRHAHRMNLSAALGRAPQPNGQGGVPPAGVEGLLSLVKTLVRFPAVLQLDIDAAGPGGAEWRELMDLSRWLRAHYQDPLQPTADETWKSPFLMHLGDHGQVEGLVKKAWTTSLVHGLPCPDWIHQGHLLAERMMRETFNLWDDEVLDTFAQDLASAKGLEATAVWPILLHHLMLAITSSSTTIDAFAKRARDRLYSLANAQPNASFQLDPSWAVASVTAFRARLDQHKAQGATVIDEQLLHRAVALVSVWLAATRQHPGWTQALNGEDRHWVEGLVEQARGMDWSHPHLKDPERRRLKDLAAQWFGSLVKADH